ncbi:hypothetical protein NDU88_011092 [Pleurodeles waltl]|uniref:Uncharacterized protein n=1 Tax=Pleurodeles waltl TaxID=8319 RepID=A0AAV7QZE3_PLEWA|nr:hypothetical protein NDU88_011092 [Pleurodeles waltl]
MRQKGALRLGYFYSAFRTRVRDGKGARAVGLGSQTQGPDKSPRWKNTSGILTTQVALLLEAFTDAAVIFNKWAQALSISLAVKFLSSLAVKVLSSERTD